MSTTVPSPVSRRSVLAGGALLVAGVTAPGLPDRAAAAGRPPRGPIGDPFTLGVASGDPDADGFVLWTRLAVDPFAEDGKGGMPDRTYVVQWELARDSRFRRLERRGRAVARPATGHSVHVELNGLPSGREYWYRFRVDGHVSPVGRALTAPDRHAYGTALSMAVASCAQYEHGFFTAYRRMAQDFPDLVLHLGDYFYEYKARDYVAPGGNVRDHAGPETTTLAGYRQRHAQYKTDADLQAAHAVAPWVLVWDDHEIDNNWADEIPEDDQSPTDFLVRRAAAAQAYYENMPLRRTSVPRGIDIRLFRRLHWGRLATFHMMDTRQYRDDQACGDGIDVGCEDRNDPTRTITGERQERWLLRGLRESRSIWDFLGQQVFFAKSDFVAGPTEAYNMDSWDGYTASRDRIVDGMRRHRVANPVVLTGDIHASWANEITTDFADPSSQTVGVELVSTSITSGGDGNDGPPSYGAAVLAENPHVKFSHNQRGYIRAQVTRDELRADFRVLPRVSQPGAAARTVKSFAVDAGHPGLREVTPRG